MLMEIIMVSVKRRLVNKITSTDHANHFFIIFALVVRVIVNRFGVIETARNTGKSMSFLV